MEYSCEEIKRLILEVLWEFPAKANYYCHEFERKCILYEHAVVVVIWEILCRIFWGPLCLRN